MLDVRARTLPREESVLPEEVGTEHIRAAHVEQLATTLFEERHNGVDDRIGSIERDLVTGVFRYHQATCRRRSSDRLMAGPPRAILALAIAPHRPRRRDDDHRLP